MGVGRWGGWRLGGWVAMVLALAAACSSSGGDSTPSSADAGGEGASNDHAGGAESLGPPSGSGGALAAAAGAPSSVAGENSAGGQTLGAGGGMGGEGGAAPALVFDGAVLPRTRVGVAYSLQLRAQGGRGADTFTLESGELPQGLKLSPAGMLSGSATSEGKATFSVTVKDADGATATASFTLDVGRHRWVVYQQQPGTEGSFDPLETRLQDHALSIAPSGRALMTGSCLKSIDVNYEPKDAGCAPDGPPAASWLIGLPLGLALYAWSSDSRVALYVTYEFPDYNQTLIAYGLVAVPIDNPTKPKTLVAPGVLSFDIDNTLLHYTVQPF